VDHVGDQASGVLIVDENGFLRKGENSVGVARQYTGTAKEEESGGGLPQRDERGDVGDGDSFEEH